MQETGDKEVVRAVEHLLPDRVVEHRVVGRQDRATGVSEDGGDAFLHQAFPDDLCSRSLHAFLQRVGHKSKTPEVFALGGFASGLGLLSA